MSIVTIPAGLCIFDREIELEIEWDPDCRQFDMREVKGDAYIGCAIVTNKIRDALEAAAKYQAEIGE